MLFEVVREPMFLMLIACGLLYLLLGDQEEALMLMGFVVVIIGITFYQERKTERARSSPRRNIRRPASAWCRWMPNAWTCLAETFDAALLNLIISVAPDGHAVFSEAWRALKPGGRPVLFDKFLPVGQEVSLPRKVLGWFFRQISTDVNRRLEDVIKDIPNGAVELNEPSLFFGQYCILRFRKKMRKS